MAVVETMEVAAMAAVEMAVDAEVTAGADAVIIAEAGVGITGAVAALADGTGIQEKHRRPGGPGGPGRPDEGCGCS